MADVLKVFEEFLRKIAGEVVEIKINYDNLPPFIVGSERTTLFWQNVSEFLEKIQALVVVEENAKKVHDSKDKKLEDKIDEQPEPTKPRNVQDLTRLDPSLVQITADKSEIDRRISAFLRKKRLDVDLQNQREFCNLLNTENEFSCARVDAVFLPRVGQKSHITVTDATRENEIMKSDDITVDTILHSIPTKRQKTENTRPLPHSIEERFENIESHLKTNVKSAETDVYDRLRRLEERILYLEGLSPEYFSYKTQNMRQNTGYNQSQGHGWSQECYDDELDRRMLQLKEKLLSEKFTSRGKMT